LAGALGLHRVGLCLGNDGIDASRFFTSALDEMIDTPFNRSNQQDAILLFDPGVPVAALAGVTRKSPSLT